MSRKKENTAIVGVGVAACAVCCAGPILGVLAAIGLGTAAGFALFGTVAIVIGAVLIAFVVVRRRRRAAACAVTETPRRFRSNSPTAITILNVAGLTQICWPASARSMTVPESTIRASSRA
jgi:mercuric ion transport protein